MAYFLKSKNDDSIINLTDYTGMYESMFNAEMAWGNIMESAMINEYRSIRNEDTSLLNETVKDFFAKAKEWFKKLFNTITRVMADVKNNIALKILNYEKFAKTVEDKVDFSNGKNFKFKENIENIFKKIDDTSKEFLKVAENFKKEIPVYKSKVINLDPDEYEKEQKEKEKFEKENKYNSNNTSKEGLGKNIDELEKSYNGILIDIKNSKNIEYNFSDSNTASIFKLCVDTLKKGRTNVKTSLTNFEKARKECTNGMKACDKQKDNKLVMYYKNSSTFINRTSSRYLNLQMKKIQWSVSYCYKCFHSTKKTKDTKASK